MNLNLPSELYQGNKKMKLFKKAIFISMLFALIASCGNAEQSANKYIESGKELLEKGELSKARLEFKNALQIDPRMAEAFYQLALIDEKQQKWQPMFKNLQTVESLDPNHMEAIVKLGQVNLLAGNIDDAKSKAEKALTIDGKNITALILKASIAMNQNDFEQALATVNEALSYQSDSVDAKSLKALVLNKQGNATEALQLIDATIPSAIEEKKLSLTMVKLSILEEQKDYAAMEAIYRELQNERPTETWIVTSLVKLLSQQGRYEDTVQVLTKHIDSNSDDQESKMLLVALLSREEPQKAVATLSEYISQETTNFEYRFAKSQLLNTLGDRDASIAELEQVIKLDPEGNDGRKARVALAAFDLQNGDIEASQQKLTEVLAEEAQNEAALILQSKIFLAQGNFDGVISNTRLVLRNNPESDEAMVLLAQAYLRNGSQELAEDNFRNALTVNPGNTVAAVSVSEILINQNELDEAEKVLQQAINVSTDKEPLIRAMTQVKLLQKDWQGAEELLDLSSTVESDSSAWSHYITANIAQGQKQFEKAIAEYKRALAVDPSMVRAIQGLAFSHIQLNQKQELLDYLEEYSANNPNQVIVYAIESEIYAADGNWEQAAESLNKGITSQPNWQAGYGQLAALYISQQQIDRAIEVYELGVSTNPTSLVLKMQLASAYEQAAKFEKAKSIYEDVLAESPDIEAAINNLASLLTDKFESPENLKKAAEITAKFKYATEPFFLDTYGWTQLKLGNYLEAEPALEKVVKSAPNVAIFHYHLAELYFQTGKKLEAQTTLDNAKRLAKEQNDTATLELIEQLATKL